MPIQARIGEVTERLVARSRPTRAAYLERIDKALSQGPARKKLGCANFAHGFAACAPGDKAALREGEAPNLAIVTAYNDMLSAHQPYERFPDIIKSAARAAGATAQVAGGVPAMCDGVTQGEAGMELSLFSRDVIALSTAVALSHQMFDAARLSRRLRQDRAGAAHRRAVLRPSAGGLHPRRADALRPRQRREVQGPPALRRGQGDAGRTAGGRGESLSRAGHLHLLRHRQHQPDADGDHGAASARRLLRQPQYAAARRADRAGGEASAGADRQGQRLHAHRPRDRRAGRDQRRGRTARHRRFDQSDDPSHRHGGGGGDRARPGTISPISPR